MDLDRLYSVFGRVSKPGQYLGNEVNVIKKDFDAAAVRIALIFPDKYEIGMSHLGLRILYDILNKIPDVVCERVFAPDLDLESELRSQSLPLFSLESKRPLSDFDVLGFSLTYELTYVNMINILDLAGIPLWQKDRSDSDPLVIAGGGGMMNAEPVADFLDAAIIGDGEEVVLEIVEAVKSWKEDRGMVRSPSLRGRNDRSNPDETTGSPRPFGARDDKTNLLNALSEIGGIYIPSLFKPEYNPDGTIREVVALKEGYTEIKKRIVQNVDETPFPTNLLVSSVKLVHDRIGVEIQRGCNHGCRFCQAGYISRPVRQRSPETVLKIVENSLKNTGIDEISLLSLSATDYDCLVPLLEELNSCYSDKKVAISVPSTRTEKLSPDLIKQIRKVRKTGFTIAPEAGTERMRHVINKGNKADDLYKAIADAFEAGWDLIKLYYMVGLPSESDDDVKSIAYEANESIKVCKLRSKRAQLNVNISSFVPKPHTPFQWETQMSIDETKRRYSLVRHSLRDRRIRLKHHNPEMSYIEGILSRGDRRVSSLLYLALKEGCRFDEWEEHFDFSKWQHAFEKWEMDPYFYLHRQRDRSEILPWDHIYAQMDKNFLWTEHERALSGVSTEDCSVSKCSDCGVCDFKEVKNRLFVIGEDKIIEKKGHREVYGWNRDSSLVASRSFNKPRVTSDPPSLKLRRAGEQPSFAKASAGRRATPFKVRIRYSKTGDARFIGHLETMGVIKRAVKRASLPICFSEGFHPQMRISMGQPLPWGIESEHEYFDLDLGSHISPDLVCNALNKALPGGLKILSAEFIDRKSASLYSSLREVEYYASFGEKGENWPHKAKEVLNRFWKSEDFLWAKETPRGVLELNLKKTINVDLGTFPKAFTFRTKINQEGHIKPREVIAALFGMEKELISQTRLKKIGSVWS